jgi:opacity protein-like surface antigen
MQRGVFGAAVGLALAGGLLCAGSAWGEEEPDYERPGWYANLGPVLAVGVGDRAGENSAGVSGRIGYRVRDFVALEVQGEVTEQRDDFGDTWTLTANARWYPWVSGRFHPYFVYGGGVLHAEEDGGEEDFAFRVGGGLDFYLNNHLVASFEPTYVKGISDVTGNSYVSLALGLQYRF